MKQTESKHAVVEEPRMTYKQFTTVLNPRSPQWSEPRGWRLHTVKVPDGVTFAELRKLRAVCGLRPRHGWGGDLFIDEPCARCEAIMHKLNAPHLAQPNNPEH